MLKQQKNEEIQELVSLGILKLKNWMKWKIPTIGLFTYNMLWTGRSCILWKEYVQFWEEGNFWIIGRITKEEKFMPLL
jgi:hypothetical protein